MPSGSVIPDWCVFGGSGHVNFLQVTIVDRPPCFLLIGQKDAVRVRRINERVQEQEEW